MAIRPSISLFPQDDVTFSGTSTGISLMGFGYPFVTAGTAVSITVEKEQTAGMGDYAGIPGSPFATFQKQVITSTGMTDLYTFSKLQTLSVGRYRVTATSDGKTSTPIVFNLTLSFSVPTILARLEKMKIQLTDEQVRDLGAEEQEPK